jgi:hypothetical protein
MERRACCALLLGALLAVLGPSFGGAEWNAAHAAGERAQQASTCIFDHLSLRTAPHTCRPRAKSYPANVTSRVERAIYDSALTFGIPYEILLAIGRCESGLNPHASNGRRFGLFQFAPATFRRAVALLRAQTGIVAHSYWNALDSSYAAGFLFATGASLSWTCESTSL